MQVRIRKEKKFNVYDTWTYPGLQIHIETRKIKDDYGVHIQDDLVISFPRKRVEV